MIPNELKSAFEKLKLNYLSDHYHEFISEMKSKGLVIDDDFFNILVKREMESSSQKSLERRIRASKIEPSKLKMMADFDWLWCKDLNRETLENLLTLKFIDEKSNVVFSGKEGVGKTMLAKNIAYQAVLKGYNVLFVDTAQMLAALSGQDSPRLLAIKEQYFVRPQLLILDEFGYLSYDHKAADILFKLINSRYEIGSIIITTNIAFTEWPKIFPGAMCVPPMIDRLIHRCEIITIDADSYRLKEAKERLVRSKLKGKAKKS